MKSEYVDNLQKLWHKLTAPRSTDEDEARREYMTKVILAIMAVTTFVTAPIFLIAWRIGVFSPDMPITATLLFVFLSGGWYLAHRGYWQLSSFIPSTVLFLAALYGASVYGIDAINVMAYTTAILLIILLRGSKAQWGALVLSIGSMWGIEWLRTFARPDTGALYQMIVPSSVFFVLVVLLLQFFTGQFQRTIAQSRAYAVELAQEIVEHQQAEEARQESERRYYELVESANSIILEWDTEGRVAFINKFGQDFFGYRAEEILGHSVVGTIVPETETSGRDLQLLMTDISTHPERYKSNENENIRKDGQRVWVAWSNKAVFDADGEFIGIQSIGNDITERKRAAEAFSESQRRLEESYQREQGRRQLADTLREVAKILTGTLEYQRVLDLILEQLENVTTCHRATVMLLTDDKRNLRVVAGRDKMGGEFEHVTVPVDRYPMNAAVLAEKQPLLIPNVVDDDRWQPTGAMSTVYSFINAPLLAQDQPIGLLAVGRRDKVPYTEDDAQTVFAFATQAAVALENARLYAETKRRVAELATLTDVGQALSSTLRVDEVLQLIYAQTRRVMYAENMIIMLHDQAGHEIECAFSNNLDDVAPGVRFPADTGLTGYIIKHRRSVLLRDSVDEGIRELGLEMAGQPSASWLGVPMLVGERVLGVIIVQHYTTPNVYDESHQVLLETIASQAAIAIENAHLFEEVQREKQYSESLVVNSPAAIVVEDVDHNITSWNPAAEKLFGYSQAEALGRHIDDLVATEAIRAEVATYTQQAARGKVVRAITQRSRKDGTMVDVELLAVPLIVEGEQVGTLVIYHDITELQRARQEAEAANRAKSAFLATMSHEIRTPMNGVIGMTSLLLDTDLTPEQHEFTETIRQSGDALLTIINDVLDFSKIEAGRMDLESQPFDLRQCVESALDLVATKAAEKGLEMIYTVDDQAPAAVVGDATRLRQILVNLLNNAVKFTEEGEVVVQVASEQVADTTQYELHFSVRDTGIGIPQDRMDRLFQSFSQVDASMTRRYGGTGLGLVISKRLSEMMGGTMWVESPSPPLSSPPLARGTEGGPGSTFHFTIRAEAAPVPMPTYLRGAQPDLRGRRMLIVDDNDTNRRILMLQAQSWGMLPRDTALPAEALDWVHRGDPFDVAVLDVQMPEMDGMTLAEKIRQEHDTRALPIILLSSLGLREADAAEGEFIPCLTKPVKASQLYNVLVGIFVAQEQTAKRDDVTAKAQFDPEMGQRLPLRILLAEDNVVNQKLALRLLERMGYRADLAANGLEALEALRRQSYDVVLMDVQMPEMDGLEATRIICQEWTQERRPRIIAMTANVMQEDREAYLAAGMDDYVGKPIQVGELVNALNKCRPLVETRCSEMAEREGTEA